jgi:hypothetical protein
MADKDNYTERKSAGKRTTASTSNVGTLVFGPIQRQQELRVSLAGLGLSGNTQRGGHKMERDKKKRRG